MVFFTETDLADFLAEFGESAITNEGVEIEIIFTDEFALAGVGGPGIESSAPIAIAKTEDVKDLGHNGSLLIGGVLYNIVGMEPDGEGMILMRLSR